ncbi:MAG TPA: hypothetical protein VGL56_13700 [Fimbriimonadaceae bacterium]|jgi:hypothetical protein
MHTDRLIEIVEIDRRQFLRIAGGALISLSGLGLIGCGGNGVSTSTTQQLSQTSGIVQLPAGISATGLTVESNTGSSKISNAGGFTAGTVGVPTLAYVVNAKGNVILMGFVDPQSKSNVINAVSTAVALLFFSLDGYAIPDDSVRTVLNMIQQNAATATLAQTISARLASNPLALDSSDSQVTSALRTAYNSILGFKTAILRPAQKPQTTGKTNALVEVTGGTQSGFMVAQDAANEALIGTNTYRRWCRLYLYETGTVDSNGTVTNYPVAKLIGTPISVPSTERLNLFTTLQALFTSTTPFSPVNTAAIPVNIEPNTTQTLYDVVVLGSSGILVDPAFFSEAKYSGQVATWKADQGTLNLQSAVIDILFGMALNMLGVGGLSVFSDTSIAAALKELEAFGDLAWKTAIVDAISGKTLTSITFRAGAYLLGNANVTVLQSKTFLDYFWNAYNDLEAGANAAKSVALSEARFGVLLGWGFKVVLGAISGASVVLGAGDLAAVIKDFGASNKGDIWNVLITIPTIHLTPNTVSITPGVGQPPLFTATPSAGVTETVTWTWTLTGGVAAQLSDGTKQGTTLTTADASVSLLTTPLDINTMVVSVTGSVNGVSIGTAKSTVNINSATKTGTVATTPRMLTFPNIAPNFGVVVGFATLATSTSDNSYQWPAVGQGNGNFCYVTESSLETQLPPALNTSQVLQTQNKNLVPGSDIISCFNLGGGVIGWVIISQSYGTDGNSTTQTLAQAQAQVAAAIQTTLPATVT